MATSNISYYINYSDRSNPPFVIAPLGTNAHQAVPVPLSLTFTGYRNPVYGEALWTNFLHLLERFASSTAPPNPVLGQIWFDKQMLTHPGGLGTLKVCTDPVGPVWYNVSNRVVISTTQPSIDVTDRVLWFNPANSGLFYWDPSSTVSSIPGNPTTWRRSTDTGSVALASAPQILKWINVLFIRYASIDEYNTIVGKFPAELGLNIPTAVNQPPTDAEWLALRNYFIALGNANSVDTTPLVGWVVNNFVAYTTDRFGIALLGQYYDALDTVTTNIFAALTHGTTVPSPQFTLNPSSGIPPLTVTVVDTSANAPTSWSWSFGDGATAATSTAQHTYTTQGVFTVRLIASNIAGTASATKTVNVAIPVVTPVASFTRQPGTGSTPLLVTFVDTSVNAPTSWLWTFGDGGTSTDQHPAHTYATIGTFNATLVATNSAGSSLPAATVINAVIPRPVASFTYTQTDPLTIAFTDTSSNSPIIWAWDFGDQVFATTQDAVHQYDAAGTYSVTLQARNTTGISDRITINVVVV